jgi:hypothetical protein
LHINTLYYYNNRTIHFNAKRSVKERTKLLLWRDKNIETSASLCEKWIDCADQTLFQTSNTTYIRQEKWRLLYNFHTKLNKKEKSSVFFFYIYYIAIDILKQKPFHWGKKVIIFILFFFNSFFTSKYLINKNTDI